MPHTPQLGLQRSPESWSKNAVTRLRYQEGLCVPMAHHAALEPESFMDEKTLCEHVHGSRALPAALCDPTSSPPSINKSTAGELTETQRGEFCKEGSGDKNKIKSAVALGRGLGF